MHKPEEDPARQFGQHLLSEDFCDALNAAGATPIIIIGKSPGKSPDAYQVYSISDEAQLVAETLIMMAIKVTGLAEVRNIVAALIDERNRDD